MTKESSMTVKIVQLLMPLPKPKSVGDSLASYEAHGDCTEEKNRRRTNSGGGGGSSGSGGGGGGGGEVRMRIQGFLRRRNTDSNLGHSSVRPRPEEAKKWSHSFLDLMHSKYGQALFRAFLQREYSEENIEFWLAVEDYRKTRSSKQQVKARKIYNDYIATRAPKEVNLDNETRTVTFNNVGCPESDCFDLAQKRVQGLMERDAYLRFLESDLYKDLVDPPGPDASFL